MKWKKSKNNEWVNLENINYISIKHSMRWNSDTNESDIPDFSVIAFFNVFTDNDTGQSMDYIYLGSFNTRDEAYQYIGEFLK